MLQINLKSFKKELLIIYSLFISTRIKELGLKYSLINIPTKKKRLTLLKSPHVHKKAREQFELRLYKKTIFIKNFKNLNYLKPLLTNTPKLINISVKYLGK